MDSELILRRNETARRVGVSLRTLDRWELTSDFPKKVSLGPRAVGYPAAAINDWIALRIASASSKGAKQ